MDRASSWTCSYDRTVNAPDSPLTPRQSLSRGCLLVLVWLLVLVLVFGFVISQQMQRPSGARGDAGRVEVRDGAQAPR
ncbi:MAG TPA: hypothetical protein VK762_34495 [Polyangiaceae bacterium]|nr:hypothetical protein [Polyangiaceae bacterium]